MSIAQMSLYGGVIILLIAIARTLWRDKLPGKVFSILWVVALVRLLVPFSIPSSVSVYTLFGKCRPILEKKAELLLEQWGTEVSSQTVQNSQILQFGSGGIKPSFLWQMIWLAKMALPVENAYIRDWKGKHPLEERITSIMKKRQITHVSGVFAGVLIMGTAVMFTTSADSVKESDNPIMRGEEIGENEDSKPSLPTKEQVGNGNEYNEETKAAAEAEVIKVDAEIRRELQQVNEWLAENGEERNVGLAEELVTLDEEIQKALGTLEK